MAYDALDPAYSRDLRTRSVLAEVLVERKRQDEKWGEQNHPNGTGEDYVYEDYADNAIRAKTRCDRATWNQELTWDLILLEEVYEALAESDPGKLRTELVQVAAVATAWVEKIDREAAQASS